MIFIRIIYWGYYNAYALCFFPVLVIYNWKIFLDFLTRKWFCFNGEGGGGLNLRMDWSNIRSGSHDSQGVNIGIVGTVRRFLVGCFLLHFIYACTYLWILWRLGIGGWMGGLDGLGLDFQWLMIGAGLEGCLVGWDNFWSEKWARWWLGRCFELLARDFTAVNCISRMIWCDYQKHCRLVTVGFMIRNLEE